MERIFIRMFALFYNFDNSFVPPGEKGKTLLSLFPYLKSITSAVATDWELPRVALVAERKPFFQDVLSISFSSILRLLRVVMIFYAG